MMPTLLLQTDAQDEGIEMCSVRVGQTLYGVPVTRILEILGRPAKQPVPLAPSYIGGLVHYRGEVLTAVSLRRLVDLPEHDAVEDILVFEGGDGYFGLLVDEVGEVMTVQPANFESNPSTLDDRRKALFAGTYKLNNALLVMLDPDRLDPMCLAETSPA
ncbi:chemotaxis protein CheW [Alloacidobacterium dinghuense]|uniref:Chemotaxis protein CheW n=1 Tax=Alloacidobacterium dinghuense TaxID=2763107 RepID=A0A7G8BL71_9BACT|nr:chemotaxis protein CheW [Alloacidobacterium dinghuense]QNI33291.1 chemotaxis protein CheW [Alloacidobacterium dinghuense]